MVATLSASEISASMLLINACRKDAYGGALPRHSLSVKDARLYFEKHVQAKKQ